jgi:hypothetical protein
MNQDKESVMDNLRSGILTIIIIFFLTLSSQVTAKEFVCWLSAPVQDDI